MSFGLQKWCEAQNLSGPHLISIRRAMIMDYTLVCYKLSYEYLALHCLLH